MLCMERLGQWLRGKVAEGKLKEVKASRQGHGLCYLFFADDLFIFSEAKEDQLLCIKKGLDMFCSCSCQRVNFQKSLMFCSFNVPNAEDKRLSACLGIPLQRKIGR